MYDKIEQMYKRESAYAKFSRIYFLIVLCLYLFFIITGLLKIGNIISLLAFLFISILFLYVYIFYKLGYTVKQYKQFLKPIDTIKKYKNNLKNTDKNLVKKILEQIKIKEKDDIKIIIEHYRPLAITQKHKFNYINFLGIIISLFAQFKDAFIEHNINTIHILAFLVILLLAFSVLYFCFKNIVDLKDIITGNRNLYKNIEELMTEEYFNY